MRIALVTCSTVPTWEKDDRPFVAALAARGARVEEPRWDDPAVAWESFDAALIRTTWDYVPRVAEFVAWAARAGAATRLFNPSEIVRWNADKGYLEELGRRGVPLAPTIRIAPGKASGLVAAVASLGARRAFLKPVVGASAVGTLRFDCDAAGIRRAAEHLAAEPGTYLLQPYLARVETEGERSLIIFDGKLSHSVVKVPVAGDYRVQDDYGATDRPYDPTPEEREVAERALAAAPGPRPPLYARVDLLNDDAGRPVLTELELIEPSLFFRHDPSAAGRLADALLRRL